MFTGIERFFQIKDNLEKQVLATPGAWAKKDEKRGYSAFHFPVLNGNQSQQDSLLINDLFTVAMVGDGLGHDNDTNQIGINVGVSLANPGAYTSFHLLQHIDTVLRQEDAVFIGTPEEKIQNAIISFPANLYNRIVSDIKQPEAAQLDIDGKEFLSNVAGVMLASDGKVYAFSVGNASVIIKSKEEDVPELIRGFGNGNLSDKVGGKLRQVNVDTQELLYEGIVVERDKILISKGYNPTEIEFIRIETDGIERILPTYNDDPTDDSYPKSMAEYSDYDDASLILINNPGLFFGTLPVNSIT